jgi:hypothetical protein
VPYEKWVNKITEGLFIFLRSREYSHENHHRFSFQSQHCFSPKNRHLIAHQIQLLQKETAPAAEAPGAVLLLSYACLTAGRIAATADGVNCTADVASVDSCSGCQSSQKYSDFDFHNCSLV